MSCEEACWSCATATGLIRPNPPSLAGKASSSRTKLPGGDCPVSAGIKMSTYVIHCVSHTPFLLRI